MNRPQCVTQGRPQCRKAQSAENVEIGLAAVAKLGLCARAPASWPRFSWMCGLASALRVGGDGLAAAIANMAKGNRSQFTKIGLGFFGFDLG